MRSREHCEYIARQLFDHVNRNIGVNNRAEAQDHVDNIVNRLKSNGDLPAGFWARVSQHPHDPALMDIEWGVPEPFRDIVRHAQTPSTLDVMSQSRRPRDE